MVIILAGPDCSGKSTVFDKLDKEKYNLIKGTSHDDPRIQMNKLEQLLFSDGITIYDRCPVLDDLVYSPIFEEGKLSELLLTSRLVGTFLRQCVVVYFSCNIPELIDRMMTRGDEYIAEKNIPVIVSNYRVVFRLLGIEPKIVETDKLTPDEVFEVITSIIGGER